MFVVFAFEGSEAIGCFADRADAEIYAIEHDGFVRFYPELVDDEWVAA